MSSPTPGEEPSFETLLSQGLDPMHTFGASSPIQSGYHGTFNYDPAAPSPYTALGKTPTAKFRNRATEAYLVSPLAAGSSNSLAARIRNSANMQGSPLFKRHEEDSQVTVVEPTNTWEDGDLELPGSSLDFDAYSHHSPYESSMKARSVAATPVPMTLPDLTPTNSPRVLSAPSTVQRRTQRAVTGLGSPSVRRSGGRGRQATYDASGFPVSPSMSRRRIDSNTSLTTSAPLVRNISSSSYLGPPVFTKDRVVSNASMMTASTSYEVMSPHLTAFPQADYPMITSHSLPELVGSQHPSPQKSGPRSPVQTPQHTGAVFFTSPEADQGGFGEQQHELSLMGGVSHIMGGQNSMQNSTSMGFVPQFSHDYNRQQTLSTIVETPALIQDGTMSYSNMMPTQPTLQQHQFDGNMAYPPVPGLQQQQSFALPTTSQPIDVQAWSSQTYNVGMDMNISNNMPMFGYSQPTIQRHASASYIYPAQPMHSHQMEMPHLSAPGMGARSVSAPFISMSSMPSMSMPTSLTSGGLFGPGPGPSGQEAFDHSSMSQYNHVNSGALSAPTSPETPRKRKSYPRIGNPLRPGPKPKPKTPKKGKGSTTSEASSPDTNGAGGGVDPLIFAAPALGRIDEGYNEPGPSKRAPSPPKALQFGPDISTVVMQRQLSGSAPPPQQPQLVIQPPRQNITDGGISGLPRSFLEKLYTTFLTIEGSVTGQPSKRFKCLIEGCERHFPRKSAIHSHIQTHLEDKPFICSAEDCGAAFVRQHDLRRHMRIHSGTKPFPCPCGKGFARGDALHRHRQRGICSGSIVPRRNSRSPPRYDPY